MWAAETRFTNGEFPNIDDNWQHSADYSDYSVDNNDDDNDDYHNNITTDDCFDNHNYSYTNQSTPKSQFFQFVSIWIPKRSS